MSRRGWPAAERAPASRTPMGCGGAAPTVSWPTWRVEASGWMSRPGWPAAERAPASRTPMGCGGAAPTVSWPTWRVERELSGGGRRAGRRIDLYDAGPATGGRVSEVAGDVIVLESVRKEFGSFVAVESADLTIGRGEFFAMLGPSGCGKTTTLKMIAGFEQPTSGRVLLEGEDVSRVPPHKRNVNTVFQQYALFPHMTVAENVAFGPKSKQLSKDVYRSRVDEMLDVVRLRDFAARKPAQLSGGQQQRVALARALVNLPERAAARRAARRARPQAARGDAARAQAHPARGRDHVRLRHPRPGRGADDVRPHRRHERGRDRAGRHAGGDLPPAGVAVRRRLHRLGQPAARRRRRPRRRRHGDRAERGRAGCGPRARRRSTTAPGSR